MRGINTRRRGFTLAELSVSIISATLLVGMAAMAMRVSMQARNQRSDQSTTMMEGREALETIERLVSRAVEVTEWDAATNTPTLADATGEAGDSFTVNVTGTQAIVGTGTTFNAGDVISHDGTAWTLAFRLPPTVNTTMTTWDLYQERLNPQGNGQGTNGNGNGNQPGKTSPVAGAAGGVLRIINTDPAAIPFPNGPWNRSGPGNGNGNSGGLAPPAPGWYSNDFVVAYVTGGNGNGGGGNQTTRWTYGSWHADTNSPQIDDTTGGALGAIGRVLYVSRAAPGGTIVDLGSGPMVFVVGDCIVKTPSGWRKVGWQNSMRNFKAAQGTADNAINGIQFYADVDPDVPLGTADADVDVLPGPPVLERKKLEWVWIWWDGQRDADQTVAPFERRGPVKVAIFRSRPRGAATDTHESWSRDSHNFFMAINGAPNAGRKAYFTTASNFGTLQMRVQSIPRPTRGGQVTWNKRVAVTGGVFLDRTGELAALGTNPWDEVSPGTQFMNGGTPGRFSQVPSYTFSKSIYLTNANAVTDSANRPFTYHPQVLGTTAQVMGTAVSWQIDYATGIVKNEHVVQPR